jgi:uncharacterized protein
VTALLDVNFLIALTDPGHQFHLSAKCWIAKEAAQGWASCPLTQNGCIRIVSQSSYRFPVPLLEAIHTLRDICTSPHHTFWGNELSLLDDQVFDHSKIHGHRQLTDIYLLALAVKHGGRLVTFDREIPLNAVRGAKRSHLVVV